MEGPGTMRAGSMASQACLNALPASFSMLRRADRLPSCLQTDVSHTLPKLSAASHPQLSARSRKHVCPQAVLEMEPASETSTLLGKKHGYIT